VHGEERKDEVFVAEQAVWLSGDGVGDPRAESEDGFDSGDAVDAHAEIDDGKVRIRGEIDGAAVDGSEHRVHLRCKIQILALGRMAGLRACQRRF
jgi:hypothetical protein